jgi:hypothetical protein
MKNVDFLRVVYNVRLEEWFAQADGDPAVCYETREELEELQRLIEEVP